MNDSFTMQLEMSSQQMQNIFGMQDAYVKKIERDFNVEVVNRNGSVAVTGQEAPSVSTAAASGAKRPTARPPAKAPTSAATGLITAKGRPRREYVAAIESTPVCGVAIRKEVDAAFDAP